MQVDHACELINRVVFKPGVRFDAQVAEGFQASVKVRISWWAPRFNREDAPHYEAQLDNYADFVITCTPQCTENDIYRKLLGCWARIDSHEAREALRDPLTLEAPFHPHRHDGMDNWGDPYGDLTFGMA